MPRRTAAAAAEMLVDTYTELRRTAPPHPDAQLVKIEAPPRYDGDNPHVHQMMEVLEDEVREDVVGAYVHGSLATHEAIAYSDFDALIILKHQVCCSFKRFLDVCRALRQAQRFMYRLDPLQHHGWFVLTELDLAYYSDAYFPSSIFEKAQSLLTTSAEPIVISKRAAREEQIASYHSLVAAVLGMLRQKKWPENLYALKSLLSQVMLLPALYVQLRDGRPVWKGDSFQLAKDDFDPSLWKGIEVVSSIRSDWSQEIPRSYRMIFRSTHPFAYEFRKRWARIPIPEPAWSALSAELLTTLNALVLAMNEKLDLKEEHA